jgi:hypothetical protein
MFNTASEELASFVMKVGELAARVSQRHDRTDVRSLEVLLKTMSLAERVTQFMHFNVPVSVCLSVGTPTRFIHIHTRPFKLCLELVVALKVT